MHLEIAGFSPHCPYYWGSLRQGTALAVGFPCFYHKPTMRTHLKLPSKQAKRSKSVCRAARDLLFPAQCQTAIRVHDGWKHDGLQGEVSQNFIFSTSSSITNSCFRSAKVFSRWLCPGECPLRLRSLYFMTDHSSAIEAEGCSLRPSGINAEFLVVTSAEDEI